ncbi:ATPase [Forsythia ovata]|uniref:Midasin n=1 Tax=Forsythia ovata TaxID=205694 RepID=A0ABD1PEU6_9LAMI
MAVDGSFRLEVELQRFLAQCPKLASIPYFDDLQKKGEKVTEKEVVNAVVGLFLHPNYTIPLVGCFRPIAQKIVEQAVSSLHLVPNLRSDNDDSTVTFDEDKFLREVENTENAEVVSVIESYVRRGKGLCLHELACLAFCRAIDLVPFLMGAVLNYFKIAPPPFERIRQSESVSEALSMGSTQILNVVRASYRFLVLEPEIFTRLWDWSCFLDLVQQSAYLEPGKDTELRKNVSDIRWCGVQILSVVLKLSFKAPTKFGLDSEVAFQSWLRWQEFCMDVSLEKAGWCLESYVEEKTCLVGKCTNFNDRHCLEPCSLSSFSASSRMLHETVPSNWSSMLETRHSGNPFILTSAVKKSFEMVMIAVSQRWPVLLYGPAGAGKTALISKLAGDLGRRVLSIHMDEQIDGKTLIGTYVSTEQPGEFRWQPGSLTQAVLNGFWVVFENVDKAPPDIQSILLPLLEGATTFLTSHGEGVRVNESFRLFSTVTSSKLDTSHFTEGRNSLGAIWRKVKIGQLSTEDLLNIVIAWYHELEPLAEKLVETFEGVNQLTTVQFGIVASSSCHGRFSLRDLLKWCKRISGLGFFFHRNELSAYARDNIYKEAIDIFASFSTSAENRLAIMKEIAKLWSVSAAETLYPADRPIIQELRSDFRIGRVTLQSTEMAASLRSQKKPFVEIRSSVHVLERIASSVKFNEPVLLVGETGTGKTTLVQSLATRLGQKLTVLNLSQQSDVADLLGGFKPMDARFVCVPLYKEFENLFTNTFSSKDNEAFLTYLRKFLTEKNWKMLFSGFQKGVRKIVEIGKSSSGKKRKRPLSEELFKAWENFSLKLERARTQVNALAGMIFSFVEGAFITALKNGEWILLDEVNLAPPEILQRVIGVLEEEKGSLCLAERGDVDYVCRHPNFRIFACMNPATDAGKRDLPFSLRSRFTEYFVDDVLDDEDLSLFINQFMDDHSDREMVSKIVHFYKAAKKESEERLQDGANQRPQYSLRSLYRALEYTEKAKRRYDIHKSRYDGFCMFFLTLLDEPSAKLMHSLVSSHLLVGREIPKEVPFDSYLMVKGSFGSDDFLESYVLTRSVKEHLKNVSRAIFIGRYPVLLQGPTSSGKTSLVKFLATITGHQFVRINNHDHTDLQEYLGSYITDASGKLVFHEGALVKAVRNGNWIVLDELNLAPSDVLEALNRLLDDNRELFVPELREVIRAHPDFMLFATQNPPTIYGGRKMLSRAFRNRFVEIHVDEIPLGELSTILEKRCKIPESYAKKMVDVMKELQLHRQSSKIFAGKHGFITPRDLFRWADRFRTFGNSYEDLARDGYYLMAERLRDDGEKIIVQDVLEKQLRVKLSVDDLYTQEPEGTDRALTGGKYLGDSKDIEKIIWTRSMWRMYFLIERCYRMREPVLLVGETGGGKTTVCQLLSIILRSKLHILNCHQYTETSDFLGGFYPVRERSTIISDFQNLCEKLMQSKTFIHFPGDATISTDINQASFTLNKLSVIIKSYRQGPVSHPDVTTQDLDYIEQVAMELDQLLQKWQTIFMWQDGPLVEAMKNGDMFLVDEISLADDSVLERLNSVLEPERKLSLAEKGGSDLENIIAHPNFFLLATMNPGGDYGKKELSPALRNRFTEIWVPSVSDADELKSIALERILNPQITGIVDPMLNFWEWFNHLQTGRILTVRDLLSWVSFINATEGSLQAEPAFLHGSFLVLLDGLSLGTNISKSDAAELRMKCLTFLLEKLKEYNHTLDFSNFSSLESYGWANLGSSTVPVSADGMQCDDLFGIHPFYIGRGAESIDAKGFEFLAPTTRRNALRVLRAMQLSKPVLLEGSPGVGKTSLIVALGKYSGHTVVRINLSEQTDMMDLLGSDLPVESDEGIQFAWSDGILLQALKKGSWVLLDELNLAPQSVLEGLNAILDHRAEVFIPELGRSFKCPTSFRVFACQNPSYQGGGRKGLPKSFLNRFTKVYVDELVEEDYLSICSSLYTSIPRTILLKLVLFNRRLHEETMVYHKFGQDGSPWEFNLRDVIRSCQIIQGAPEKSKLDCFLSTVYLQRMRTPSDRRKVVKLYEQVFGLKPLINPQPRVQLNPYYLTVGSLSIERNRYQPLGIFNNELKILPSLRHSLEAVAQCVKHNWLCILVGPPSSGKTSLIRSLAQLTGNVLNELNLSSATDISELLGCFEQHNAFRDYRLAIARVESYINEYCSLQLESSLEVFFRRKDLITRWLAFLSSIEYGPSVGSTGTDLENPRMRYFESIPVLVEIIEILRSDREIYSLCVSWSQKNLESTLNTIRKLEEDYQRRRYSVKFEWVTGLLLNAIENGEWIVLENANLCNPTVLDRINSLVEQSGSITINECGTVEGKPVVLHPHPQFRMFLTVNPSYGEVSRAMRNRGVEIYVMQPYWLLDNLDEIEFKDVKRFVTLSGIPVGKLVDMMAKAHIYAKHEGTRLDVSITYLELARWVQLFKRLVTNGNQPIWSLQISWEHTYLSSLGEGEGKDIVAQATVSYLSVLELGKFPSAQDDLLCLPGGWPIPLKLRDFVCYSKETCVRQNCMYLESLGAQFACQSSRSSLSSCQIEQNLLARGAGKIYLMEVRLLYAMMFPKASNDMLANYGMQNEYDFVLAKKKLFFAANWAIEQATESDYCLYIYWFEWFGSQLQPFGSFFYWFSGLLKKEMEHPIWKRILYLRSELMSLSSTERDAMSLPILSMELVDATASVDMLSSCRGLLSNSTKCIPLLRLSFQQWSHETEYSYSFRTQHFEQVLSSLRRVEEKVLELIVESPTFDVLFQSYNDLLEHHILFWNGIVSSQVECLLIIWRCLMKDAAKLGEFCPGEVEHFQKEMKNLQGISSLSFNSQKSLLWAHGGHPSLPSSAELYQKQIQLSNLCELVWPRKTKFWKLAASEPNETSMDAALSSNSELRFLAMQGVSMSSYIIGKADDEEFTVPQQLEEMYQMLLRRLEFEKQKLKDVVETTKQASSPTFSSVCCVFSPDILCRRYGVDCWLETLPITDEISFFLDLGLLQHLTKTTLVNTEEQHHVLSNLSDLLESTLNFSLNFSSRPPTDFLPHQKILWTLDARASGHAVSFLRCGFGGTQLCGNTAHFLQRTALGMMSTAFLLPHKLFLPLKMATIDQILKNRLSIRDYPLHSFKLRVASRSLWQSSENMNHSHALLLSAARSLFQQIIYAHKKSFENAKFAKIKSAFQSIKEIENTQENIKALVSLLASSNHPIFTSLIDPFIEPLLGELYLTCSSTDIVRSLGCAWLRIGGLRYNLLTCCDDLDPTVKYSIKYSQLMEKITSLEIEIQVREECVHFAGSTEKEANSYKVKLMENLNAEQRRLRRQISFRSDPGKYGQLKRECDDFRKLVSCLVGWIMNVESIHIEEIVNQLQNWQETASCFIERLSNEYSAYVDIVQPVQVAIYEMKFGLSLILSSLSYKKYLEKIGEQDMKLVLDTIYSFMRFPRGCAARTVSVNVDNKQAKLLSSNIDLPTIIGAIHLNLLEKIIGFTRDAINYRTVSTLQLRISMYQNVLAQIKHSVADARFLDDATFKLLDEIFDKFAREWMHMKLKVKTREENQAQQFKFKTRAFKIESIIEIDISNLASLLPNESFSEWQEMLSEEHVEKTKADEEHEILEEDWDSTVESDLNDLVQVHNQLFGSLDLVRNPGIIHVSDSDRLSSFLGSYTLGVEMIKDLEGLFSSNFDAKVTPEHLLRLCMEHDHKFNMSHKAAHLYNFYKDSNSSMMVKLVEPVMILKQRILVLLNEWDDHPALQKILDVIEMIFALPLSTPLAKALSGLQFLLNRVQILQETVAKFPLSDELYPIRFLVSSWHKLEFESWPALLDEVQFQFEMNAGKLWFPLYSVLQRRHAADIDEYNQSTIQSLKEFVQMSSVGEFRKRLQLLHAFHGQISNGLSRGSYSSPRHAENVKILYNTFGLYVQFLPLILEYIETSRRNIETELKDVLQLCRWDRVENHWTAETSKRTRQKLRKIIQKYTELLQLPLMHFVVQEASRRGTNTQSIQSLNLLIDPYEKSKNLLSTVYDQLQSTYKDSSFWVDDWWKNAVVILKGFHLGRTSEVGFSHISLKDMKEVGNVFKDDVPSQSCSLYLKERKLVQHAIDKICTMIIDCVELWEDKSKNLRRNFSDRTFSDLLNLFDSCGLHKHRTFMEDEFNQSRSCLLQPSYDVQHLLLTHGNQSSGDVNVSISSHSQSSSHKQLEIVWKTANQFYFKSIQSMQALQQICRNFHKDSTLEKVERSGSYVDHLVEIQQEQRAVAYNFANQLKCLKECTWPLSNLFSSSISSARGTSGDFCFTQNQHATFKCMWQQKQLFDGFCTMLYDEHLLLQMVEDNHLKNCLIVKNEVQNIHLFIQKFFPDFQKSKDLLDRYLLGGNRDITAVGAVLNPYGVTEEMEQVVNQNFQLIRKFEDNLSAFHKQDGNRAVQEILLGQFRDLFEKANITAEEFSSSLRARNLSNNKDGYPNHREGNMIEVESCFSDALKGTYMRILDALQRVGSLKYDHALSDESLNNINEWKVRFERDIGNLQLVNICEDVVKTIQFAGQLLNYYGERNASLCSSVGEHLRQLYILLDVVMAFGNNLLQDFLTMHGMVSTMTYVLANVLATLFAKGFGTIEDQSNGDADDITQDAHGTGMGEGAGLNDVSDQITDEDQILGASEKPNEDKDDSSDVPSKNEKGIEMEQDFNASAFSVSEDSGDDENEDTEDEQLDSAMGETGLDSEIVDEKTGDPGDDENQSNMDEKYETGPSVKDTASNDKQLRAREDSAADADCDDDAGDHNPNESSEKIDENGNEEGPDDMEDMHVDKDDAFLDPTGLNPDDQNPGPEEDIHRDDMDVTESTEDGEPEDLEGSDPNNNEENDDLMDENLDEAESKQENAEMANGQESNLESNKEMDFKTPKKDVLQSTTSDFVRDNVPNAQSAPQPKEDTDAVDQGEVAPDAKWSNFSEFENDLASMSGPNASEIEIRVADSLEGKKLTHDPSQSKMPPFETRQRNQPNPCRNVGDALDGWKDRVKVSVDLQDQMDGQDDLVDEKADEYGYTAEFEKGTAQALGPATADQIDREINRSDLERDMGTADLKDLTSEMEIEMQPTDTLPVRISASNPENAVKNQWKMSESDNQLGESTEVNNDNELNNLSESTVSVKRSYLTDDINQLGKLSMNDDELGKARGYEMSADMREDAAALWRRYELLTSRLSQELAEQLRLVMEPTLASKLQGDYKTGKRINMKKVIPYIASHYRKDKIWLRRTRPNKRDYQVVIAVDDSSSMSESRCGDVAIEALVTVCRAMSQLEVGNLAVASFGQKGNIRLLHDFDQPFTGEAGIKMISSLTFKQENTIADEPMVDLLKYLNNMLDAAAMNARLPSGYNPLQQLVLIIADGRLHEKEHLKRCVRDILSKKRMVAFLLIDSPHESIMDLMEATFPDGKTELVKYLDSFPFPFYVVLKNIEALPRTLADLLRQWFELMQNSRD